MKTRYLLPVLLASLTSAFAAPQIGQDAPAFTLKDTSGKNVSLSDYKGKYVMLEWVNFGCPFVKKHYESKNMQDLQKEATGKGVVWLSICSSAPGKQGNYAPADAAAQVKEHGSNATAYLLDESGEVGKAYDARTTPEMYLINPEGKLVYMGAIDNRPTPDPASLQGAKNYAREAIDAVLQGKPVAETVTKSYGCSVKYN